jgi:hypothetical protein
MSTPEDRNRIFRERLIAINTELNEGLNRDRTVRRLVGTYALRLPQDAGARDWIDLKERADGPTYDSLLRLFSRHSEEAQKRGETSAVRAFEVLALSLISRRQEQADLLPGVTFIDRFIANCARRARRANSQFIPASRRKS